MTTVDALNEKAAAQHRIHQAAGEVTKEEQERVLFQSLFGPQKTGGRRSYAIKDMPYKGRTAGIYVPDWLRARLEKWAEKKMPGQKLTGKQLLLTALYEVCSGEYVPEEEAEAFRSLQAATQDVGRGKEGRSQVAGNGAGGTAS